MRTNPIIRKLAGLGALFSVFLAVIACGLSVQVGNPKPVVTQALSKTLTSTPIPGVTKSPTASPTSRPTPTIISASLAESVVQVPAPSLKGSLIKEAEEQPVQVYLPPSYDHTKLHYPVVYFLPGYGSNPNGENEDFSPEAVGTLMAQGKLKEMILVVPNGVNTLQGSFYVNSPVTGNWEDFIVKDVVSYIDDHYRTIPEASGRGISGHSMGGFAAFYLSMRHPDLFSAAYGLSPGLFDENGLTESLMFDSPNKPEKFAPQLQALSKLSHNEALKEIHRFEGPLGFTVAYGAAFAPDPSLPPPYFSYPYSVKNGQYQRNPEVWSQWENGFGGWPQKIAKYHDALAGLKGIVIDYGSNDFGWIRNGSVYLAQQLSKAGIANQIYEFQGTHTDHIEERLRTMMLPYFGGLLADPR